MLFLIVSQWLHCLHRSHLVGYLKFVVIKLLSVVEHLIANDQHFSLDQFALLQSWNHEMFTITKLWNAHQLNSSHWWNYEIVLCLCRCRLTTRLQKGSGLYIGFKITKLWNAPWIVILGCDVNSGNLDVDVSRTWDLDYDIIKQFSYGSASSTFCCSSWLSLTGCAACTGHI